MSIADFIFDEYRGDCNSHSRPAKNRSLTVAALLGGVPLDRAFLVATMMIAAAGLPTVAHGQLSYVERSAGLTTPRMEAGNTEFEFSDVDGDGHVDVVSIGDHGSPNINSPQHGVMVWFGDGTGNWSVFQSGNFGYGGCALGDVNGDGLMDIGYGMHHDYSGQDLGDQILEVALGDGTGRNWSPYDDGLATNGEDWGMFGTDFADVDNDGDLDVGSISFGCCAGLHVYGNNGDGTWTQSWGFLGGNADVVFTFADFNGDGFADFATAHGGGTTYLGDGAGGFSPADGNMGATWRRGVAVGDVTADGRDDLAFVTSGGGLEVRTWIGPGQWQNISGSLPSNGNFDLAQIADMDLDGFGDVIGFASGDSRQIVVYGGDGQGGWTEIGSIDSAESCDDAAFRVGTDVDHNGYPDLVIVSEEQCSPWTGGTNRPRLFVESTAPTASFVFPKSPRGGETWIAGSVRFIDWHAAAANGESTMSIDLSQRGTGGPWTTIAENVPNNGRFQYHTPADLRTSADNYLRFRMGDVIEITPAAFTIIGVEGGCTRDPAWQCDGDVDGDGQVNPVDSGLVQAAFGSADEQELCNYDLDCDGQINPVDSGIVQSLFGTCEPPREVCP